MKKLIAILLTTVLSTAGLIVAQGASASATEAPGVSAVARADYGPQPAEVKTTVKKINQAIEADKPLSPKKAKKFIKALKEYKAAGAISAKKFKQLTKKLKAKTKKGR